ncbi:hypothetical protein KKB44_05875 [Candidatus Micrarchaeota archaeon]|nr:hypothetical protein [Candidatus Micrarchaeota archaeon]
MQNLAKKQGGKCLSKKYGDITTKLKWQCKKGHVWYAIASNIKHKGRWCPHCKGGVKYQDINDMRELARKKGGDCLSLRYINSKTRLKWRCADSHTWWSTPHNIQKHWCPTCSQNISERVCRMIMETIFNEKFPKKKPKWLLNSKGNRMELDGYSKLLSVAFEYHGIQHFEESWLLRKRGTLLQRKADDERKRFLCKKHNVLLIEIPYTVSHGRIAQYILAECKQNGIVLTKKIAQIDYKKLDTYSPKKIIEMSNIAKKKGGKCLSNYYINSDTKLEWECKQGHRWFATPSKIKNANRWCPICSIKIVADKRRINKQTEKKVIKLYKEKLSLDKIGQQLSLSITSIYRILHSHRIKKRGHDRIPKDLGYRICSFCGDKFERKHNETYHRFEKRKYCSKRCKGKAMPKDKLAKFRQAGANACRGKPSWNKGLKCPWVTGEKKGKKLTDEHKKKLLEFHRSRKNAKKL